MDLHAQFPPYDVHKNTDLEQKIVGYFTVKICPFTAEIVENLFGELGFVLTKTYKCGVDDRTARGGKPTLRKSSGALTPCSLEYAETCPLYLNQISKSK